MPHTRNNSQGFSRADLLIIPLAALPATIFYTTIVNQMLLDSENGIFPTENKIPATVLNVLGSIGISMVYAMQIIETKNDLKKKFGGNHPDHASTRAINDDVTDSESEGEPLLNNQNANQSNFCYRTLLGSLQFLLAVTAGFAAAFITFIQEKENDLEYTPDLMKYIIPVFMGVIELVEAVLGLDFQKALELGKYVFTNQEVPYTTFPSRRITRGLSAAVLPLIGLAMYSVIDELRRNLVEDIDPVEHKGEFSARMAFFLLSIIGNALPTLLNIDKFSEFLQNRDEYKEHYLRSLMLTPFVIASIVFPFILGWETGHKEWIALGALAAIPFCFTHFEFMNEFAEKASTSLSKGVDFVKANLNCFGSSERGPLLPINSRSNLERRLSSGSVVHPADHHDVESKRPTKCFSFC